MRKLTDLKVIIDFEYTNTLTLKYINNNNEWVDCFKVPYIYKYITKE